MRGGQARTGAEFVDFTVAPETGYRGGDLIATGIGHVWRLWRGIASWFYEIKKAEAVGNGVVRRSVAARVGTVLEAGRA